MEEKKKQSAADTSKQETNWEQAAANLWSENRNLQNYIEKLRETLSMKRLDYLFACLKYKDLFNTDFISKCVAEIEEALTIVEEETKNKEA